MNSFNEIVKGLKNLTLREDESIEFKERFPTNAYNTARNFVGIANSGGGYFIIGVQEKENGIILTGVEKSKVHSSIDIIKNICNKYTENIEFKTESIIIDGATIIISSIQNSKATAYLKNSENERIIYFRDALGRQYSIKKLYKYMSVDSFILSLCQNSWAFFEPSKWNDQCERRFYCANYSKEKSKIAQKIFATCVSKRKDNEAAWKVYANGHGLGTHCVQLELNETKVIGELNKSSKQYDFAEKNVIYKPEDYILNLHKKECIDHHHYFEPFTLNTFLNLLSLKRNAYEYEDEIRFFAIPKDTTLPRSMYKKSTCIKLPVSWKNIIIKARVDKSCSEAEILSVQQACFCAGINPIFKPCNYSNLLPSQTNFVNIDFELFSIDDIPKGVRRITIN